MSIKIKTYILNLTSNEIRVVRMHIIKFQGGLGNQMFQYALYLKLKKLGYEVKADLSSFYDKKNKCTPREFGIEKLFGVEISIASEQEIKKLYASEEQKLKRAFIKRIGKKTYYREDTTSLLFKKEIFELKAAYLEGFWQSEKYFEDIKEDVEKAFSISKHCDEKRETVAVHVRMGDYTKPEYAKIYGGICDAEYYLKAISYFRNTLDNPLFIVYSDEINKAKEMIKNDNDIIFNDTCGFKSPKDDLVNMSECKHQIIANSSYSWWAAWLNANPGKMVIAPKRWINGISKDDVIPEKWIRV